MFRAVFAAILVLNVSLLQACGGGTQTPVPAESTASSSPAVVSSGNSAPVFSGVVPIAQESNAYTYSPNVSDADGDTLSLTAANLPSWLTFNAATGEFTGMPGEEHIGEYADIELMASDGNTETRIIFTIEVRFDALEQALRTGNHNYVSAEDQIIKGVLNTIENNVDQYRSIKHQLFELNSDGEATADSLTQVNWDPTHDAALLGARFGSNEAILMSNAVSNRSYVVQQHALAIVGENDYSRYAVFGSNPMRNVQRSQADFSDDMSSLLANTIDWLAARETESNDSINVVLSQFDESFYFPDQSAVRAWLDQTYGDKVHYNSAQSCNAGQLGACISKTTDLLLISPHLFDSENAETVATHVKSAIQNGVAVAYFHHDGELNSLAERLLALFDVDYHGDNYWRKLSIENYDASTSVSALPTDVVNTQSLVTHFLDQTFTADLSQCENKSCPSDSPYYNEFLAPVEGLQRQLRDMDKQGVRLFGTKGYRYQKLLVLLGDFYRQGVNYPMDKAITASTLFLRSLYADHTVYYNRSVNQAQRDMGIFSRSNFSHVTAKTRTHTLLAKPPFKSTGAYALPGVPFTVSRNDSHAVETHVFINTLRSGATHEFDEFGYTRPKYLQSSQFLLEPGKPLVLTSPHGGPIQISFSHKDQNVDLEFTNVGEHPYWASSVDDVAFSTKLASGDFDWAELVTSNFEVHSTLEKMRVTMSKAAWRNATQIAQAIASYTHNNPHVLAGYQGPGIDVVPEIHDFAAANGIGIAELDQVKHMNADQATCGYGCSGNPYDANWSFDPLGHGDLHEMGHGLERSRFRFKGWDSHSSTNYYSYYSKYRYFAESGDTEVLGGCQELPFSKLFATAQESVNASNPVDYMRHANLTYWSEGAAIFLQLMMRAQADGALDSGWNLLPRLHIIEREFARVDDNDVEWLATREGLGFETLSRTDARGLTNNDWLLVAVSHATARDLRKYFTLWGLEFGEVAANLVKEKNLPSLPVALHVLEAKAYCLGLAHPSVSVDGLQAWPLNN